MPRANPAPGIGRGDRCLFLGIGQLHGKQADVVGAGQGFVSLRFDTGMSALCLARDCHPVPRRPPPMF